MIDKDVMVHVGFLKGLQLSIAVHKTSLSVCCLMRTSDFDIYELFCCAAALTMITNAHKLDQVTYNMAQFRHCNSQLSLHAQTSPNSKHITQL